MDHRTHSHTTSVVRSFGWAGLDRAAIALSANAMPEDIARARAAGFEDYWTKPIDVDRFLEALAGLF